MTFYGYLIVWCVLVIGNLLWQFLRRENWWETFKISYHQGWALLAAWVFNVFMLSV